MKYLRRLRIPLEDLLNWTYLGTEAGELVREAKARGLEVREWIDPPLGRMLTCEWEESDAERVPEVRPMAGAGEAGRPRGAVHGGQVRPGEEA